MGIYNVYYVYILASKANGMLYTEVTSEFERRLYEHKNFIFSNNFFGIKLVYYEEYHDMHEAFDREKCIKKEYREWKIQLIETLNTEWKDLSKDFGI